MGNWRDIKRKMRDVVDATFRIPCVYVAFSGAPPMAIHARLRDKNTQSSINRSGDGRGWAEIVDATPTLRLSRMVVAKPKNKALVCFSDVEAYRISNVLPYDDQYVDVEVERLSINEAGEVWRPEYKALVT